MQQITQKGNFPIITDFSKETFTTRRAWKYVFQPLRDVTLIQIIHPAKPCIIFQRKEKLPMINPNKRSL